MKRKALIVDDDQSVRFVLREALRGAGWSVVEIDDGAQIEERLEGDHFDVIMLDLYMPGMNGFEVLRRVRGHVPGLLPPWKTDAGVRIVVLSGATGGDGLAFARRIGADACLAKPFEISDLLGLLDA